MRPTPSSPFVRLAAFALALTAPLAAQSWAQRTTAGAPAARNSSPATYDVYRGVTVLFGGYDGSNTPRSDTWEWNGTVWNPRTTQSQPAGRWGHGLAFDSKRGKAVLFGGYDGSGLRSDTWEWDGTSWQQSVTPTAPPARAYFGMTFDAARGVVVAFGGLGGGSSILGDTWEYDGFSWVQRSTANAPSPRRGVAMTWDETRRETLLFGGGNGTTVGNDLWAWNGTAWSQKSVAVAPPARWEGYFAFDGNCGRALLYGGANQGFTSNFGDGWAWDGLQWTQLSGAQPPARHGAAMAHDAQRGQFVVFGGRDATSFRNDLWELGPSCSRTMSVVTAPIAGQTAQFRYAYPPAAGLLHFCWTLVTPRQPAAFAVPIPGLPSIGLCRVDISNQLLSPAVFLDGSGGLVTAIPIPPSTVFNGYQFDVQSVDLDLATLTLRWADNDIEASTAAVTTPVASFTATPTIGTSPLVVQFTDTSTGNPASWQWDFNNDGVIDSTQQNPSWTYASNGVYSVRLVASNFVGSASVTRQNLIFAWPGPLPAASLNMAPIVAGTFAMGSTAYASQYTYEAPVRQVTITQSFWMGKYEVTQAQYQAVMGSNPSLFQGANVPNAAQRPVENVTWNNAIAYCQALTASEQAAGRVPAGYEYRLPTEAEWEYCCRAGTTTEWSTGTSLSTSQANFQGALANATYPSGQPAVIGSYAPNAFGLHDMHGNVFEWCLDSLATYVPVAFPNPYVSSGPTRVFRGGCWGQPYTATECRSAYRNANTLSIGSSYVGFRVVLAPIVQPNLLPNMVPIAPGTFQMGSTAGSSTEQPVHQVTLSAPFWIGKYEVTQAEYQAVVGSNPSYFAYAPNAPQRPVEGVSWDSAVAYCQALTATEQAAGRLPVGYQYRLPTEAEWEYCCRAGTTTEWSTGTSLNSSQANFQGALGETAVVGSYAPNAFGLYDMHGNVREWCLDTFATYAPGPVTHPFVTGGAYRVFRGGSWYSFDTANWCRSAVRNYASPGIPDYGGGFRVVLAPVLTPVVNMVPIAPGTFQMGSTAYQSVFPEEAPVHQVTLSYPFWMGKYEVTQADYQAVMGSNPSYFQGVNAPNAPQRPVERVTWSNAVAYCQALTATEQAVGRVPAGYQYRLPTEAEWEYCCRAGTTTEWNTGTSLSTSQANFQGALANGTYTSGQTAAVGNYAPNAFGLHDMYGNVFEWCLDSYATYAPGPVTNPFVTGGAYRVIRGGCWISLDSAYLCRSAYRNGTLDFQNYGIGFRVVLAPVFVP